MLRKFMLTGFPLLTRLLFKGSNTESVWGTMLTAILVHAMGQMSPFLSEFDDTLAVYTHLHLTITMVAGIGESSGGSLFAIASVIVPAACLLVVLFYSIFDPEFKLWISSRARHRLITR